MSHWASVRVDTTNRVWIVASWDLNEGVANDSDQPFDIYMDLEVTHSRRLLTDNSVVRTLPLLNRFTTDRDRAFILHTEAQIVTVQPGAVVGPVAVAILDRRALPEGTAYEIKMIARLVENPNAARPEDVGRLIVEHKQDNVLTVGWI
mgnify:FL=1